MKCGYSGDGAQARGAEISTKIGQIAFDVAGNLYFADTGNKRVRRIDNLTSIITTVAGNGTAGYTGDGGSATSAKLKNSTGVSVDSQGQVYILSSTNFGGADQVVRQVGTTGVLSFASQPTGSPSAAKTINVANTGNDTLEFADALLVGGNAADFKIDTHTTSCKLAAGGTLASGHSCKVGVAFNPQASGARTASLELTDNTVNGINTVSLSGTGALKAATLTITAPAVNATVKKTVKITFSVKVSGATAPIPTGNVTMKVDGTVVSGGTLVGGVASVSVTGLTVGTHSLSAIYNGDAVFSPTSVVSRSINVTN